MGRKATGPFFFWIAGLPNLNWLLGYRQLGFSAPFPLLVLESNDARAAEINARSQGLICVILIGHSTTLVMAMEVFAL
jgi:hypothetical protein